MFIRLVSFFYNSLEHLILSKIILKENISPTLQDAKYAGLKQRNAPFGGSEAKAGKETAVASKVRLPEFRSADPKAVDSIVEGMERTGTK